MAKCEKYATQSCERPPKTGSAPDAEQELWDQLGNAGYADHLQGGHDLPSAPDEGASPGGLGGILGGLDLGRGLQGLQDAGPAVVENLGRLTEQIPPQAFDAVRPGPIGLPDLTPAFEMGQWAGQGLRQGLDYGREQWQAAQPWVDEAVADLQDIYGPQLANDAIPALHQRRLRLQVAADSTSNQAHLLDATNDIPNQDIIYEQLARNLAYGKSDPAQLALWGYGPPQVMIPADPITGMYAVAVRPRTDLTGEERAALEVMHQRSLRSVLAFRGSEDAVDWADDLLLEFIGAFQFTAHRSQIAKALADLASDGPPDTVGHSLGGALAQLAATVGAVHRIVTFQAPGISSAHVDQIDTEEEATHHRAANDAVAWAGDTHAQGDAYVHTTNQNIPGLSHIQFQLTALNDLRASHGAAPTIPGIYDSSVFSAPDREMGGDSAPISELDPTRVARYDRRQQGGHQPKLAHVHRPTPADEAGGRSGNMYERGRQGTAEFARRRFGDVAGVSDWRMDTMESWTGYRLPSAGEWAAYGLNLITGGNGLEITTSEMSEFVGLAKEYEDRARAEARDAEPGEIPGIVERLVNEVEAIDGLHHDLRPKIAKNIAWAANNP